ncbi:MAG: hypothetical protein K6A62_08530 [Bacteroidales bacterium]|nr:hypothetical protein [Bacteroidales bacterium]
MDLESLFRAYKASRKHNSRSEDMVAFEVDKYVNLRRLRDKINARSYFPLHNYSFMHRRSFKPREVFAAEPELKVMMTFALQCITPLVEAHLSPRTFNNRVGMGTHLAVNTLIQDIYEVSCGYTKPCHIIKIDYKGYFPNMDRDHAWKLVYGIVRDEYHRPNKQDVIYCLMVACYCDPCRSVRKSPAWEWADYPAYKSIYTRPPGVGGMIGFTFWQMIACLYPIEIARFVAENISEHFVIFVDDTVIITDDKEAALAQLPAVRRKGAEIGITLHPRKFYCQPYEHGVEFLGYYILPDRVHLKRRIVQRAFEVVRSRERGLRNYVDSINSYLGMIKSTSDLRLAKDLLDAVPRHGVEKDYDNYKLKIVEHQNKSKWIGRKS